MKKSERTRFGMVAVLVTMAIMGFSSFLCPVPSQAGVTCSPTMSTTSVAVADGFTDYQKCYGFTMADGTQVFGQANCPGENAICLNTDTRDLFVILVPASPSHFPPNPLQKVSNPVSQDGLGISVHLISSSQANSDRTVTAGSTQKAVMITESLDTTTPNVLGFSNTGTPNGLDKSTIYTQRIKNFIQTICETYGTSSCADSTSVFGDALVQKYILHVINHEVGHVLGPLAPLYNASYGGYHYKSGTNVIMDQSVYYTSKKGKVTFYIGADYTASDQNSVKLE